VPWQRPSARSVVLFSLGALVVLAVVAVDPAALAFLMDADFLVAIGSAGLLMLGADLRLLARRAAASTPAVLVRAGAAVTRARPASLLA
jgi:hypothetical protein